MGNYSNVDISEKGGISQAQQAAAKGTQAPSEKSITFTPREAFEIQQDAKRNATFHSAFALKMAH